MFKRIGLCLLAASVAFGAVVTDEAVSDPVVEATPEATPAQPTNGFVPRISEEQLATAERAPVYTQCQKPGQFVITFDDGPKKQTTPIALKYLKEHNIKATFFINSENYSSLENDPEAVELVKQEFNEGHDIGSHTYSHTDLFDAIDQGTMEENIDKMTDKIEQIIGVKPAFFRPPNGNGGYPDNGVNTVKNERAQKYLGASGYSTIMWGADTKDWDHKQDPENAIVELDKYIKAPGVSPATHSFISLMHDVHPSTVNTVLPMVVEHVTQLGYTIVPLTECIGVKSAYQPDPSREVNNLITANSTQSTDPEMNDDESSASITQVKMIFSIAAVILSLCLL